MFLYSPLSSSLDRLKRFTLSSPGRPVHANTNSVSLGSILVMQQLRATTIHSHFHHSPASPSSVAVSVAGVGDHDLPLFAISCIHKHLRSASSQPGCYTVLYFLFFDDLCFFFLRSFLLSTNALAFPFSSHGLEILLVFS